MVAATTRLPEEIPPAIRSRCVEIFFRPLLPHEIALITKNAVQKMNMEMEDEALQVVTKYATNGREAVNIVQIAAGAAINEGIQKITLHNVEWVINNGQHDPRPDKKVPDKPQVGLVNGLAVAGPNIGMLLELETIVTPVAKGQGQIIVTGVVDEEVGGGSGKTAPEAW